jgi:hypothetical protein
VCNSYLCDGPASTGAADYREMKRECKENVMRMLSHFIRIATVTVSFTIQRCSPSSELTVPVRTRFSSRDASVYPISKPSA